MQKGKFRRPSSAPQPRKERLCQSYSASNRYGDYGLRTTAETALSFVCSTGLSRANIERYDCTTDSRLREERRRGKQHAKIFLFSCSVHRNASILLVILSLEKRANSLIPGEPITSGEIGERSFGHTVFLIFSPMNTYVKC